jgi:hypothetical protein
LDDALADVEKELLARAGELLELASTARANGRDAYADQLIQFAAELLHRAASSRSRMPVESPDRRGKSSQSRILTR